MEKKEIRKEYFMNLMINRLSTQDRNSAELNFIKPRIFKTLFNKIDRHFINEIIIPHANTLKIYFLNNDKVDSTTFSLIDCFLVEKNKLYIKLDNEVYTVLTPTTKNRDVKNIESFIEFQLTSKGFTSATIDHFPTLITYVKECKKKYSFLMSYYQEFYCSNKKTNEIVKELLVSEKLDLLWKELKSFYANTKIELVHQKYNTRDF